ncbi:MAG: hypothetical protein WCX77_03210 [Candidatus Paceibacterota bacterium]|jgi:hypothetical protein
MRSRWRLILQFKEYEADGKEIMIFVSDIRPEAEFNTLDVKFKDVQQPTVWMEKAI